MAVIREKQKKQILMTPEIFQESASTATASDGMIHKWVAQLVIPPDWFDKENTITSTTKLETMMLPVVTAPVVEPMITPSTFGAIIDSTPVSSSSSSITKRKRSELKLTPAQHAYRKKMNTDRLHEKVYFLGKFDSEMDARGVLEMVGYALSLSFGSCEYIRLNL